MSINRTNTQRYLRAFDFKKLFREELGWDNYQSPLPIRVEETVYTLQGIAEKHGVVAFLLAIPGGLPPHALRRKIERQVAPRHREHLIIYSDGRTTQIWQWVRQEQDKPLASREHHYTVIQSGDALIQKLDALAISLEDEESLTLFDVRDRVRRAFDVEKVTKKFYDQFKKEHSAFSKFLKGIPTSDLADWYVSVMLNRLMFIYFLQKKGFLEGDSNYLRNHLAASERLTPDRFYTDFLCPLFFDGFATPKGGRSTTVQALLGDVPYLNGGIFARHQIERMHGQTIQIPDKAFKQLFAFFEQYQWHLDDRPLRNANEINPDVLGYIFEKYINQKQMGAYYTQEDITEYIAKNSIIPYLFDAAQREQPAAFKSGGQVWSLLAADPDRYIYPAVAHGSQLPLPPEIAAGVGDVAQRGEWNKPAADGYGLPTEIWRETVARLHRYTEVRAKLVAGEVQFIDDLITYNLNIRQFAQDVIENCEDPRLLRAIWKAIRAISVLDPTCGSGAFHFAALNILEPLYEASLERMEAFVQEDEQNRVAGPARFDDFRKALGEVARHPNQRYFILKSIIVDNLYGVDIMHEAVEIAKLRLFLKLVSLVDDGGQIEPLPDIDFNIRAGNTLVGFATRAEMERAVRGDRLLLLPEDEELLARIDEQAADVDRLFARFRQMQMDYDPRDFGDDFATAKQTLHRRLEDLAGQLDRLLAQQYGVKPDKPEFAKWRESHQPFHWFAEFYGIVKRGGFDVVIGNPPYVEYAKIRQSYTVLGYRTVDCGNLYAFVMERNKQLLQVNGLTGMIVPHSAFCTDRMSSLMTVLQQNTLLWVSSYDIRPAKLFVGVDQRLAIYLQKANSISSVYSTKYHRWQENARSNLFATLRYTPIASFVYTDSLAKTGTEIEYRLWQKLHHDKHLSTQIQGHHKIYFHNAPRYWIRVTDFIPYFWNERDGEKLSTQVKEITCTTPDSALALAAILNSSLFYWWFIALSDSRHLNLREIHQFPIEIASLRSTEKSDLNRLAKELMEDYQRHKMRKETYYQATGKVVYDEYYPRHSKSIIDEIDRVLATHYGFTDEELDFIINYDIKYRMGDALDDDSKEAQ
ncbi:MAG: Eco57I restriction-modification methylase domain-containing protein [Chloroflexi bacterium]|nr:Eco57I restriction-modification methylase domain-containing protein [Chloroflexota bacterium]